MAIQVGQGLPEVRLPDQTGTEIDLASYRGRPVLIYFYPRDDTPGCTAQACGIRDRWAEFEQTGTVVVGVSADDVASHAAFAAKFGLHHRLLADPDRQVIDAFGAWGRRTRASGEVVEGVLRTTFLVDQDGQVDQIWKDVDPTSHADDLLAAIDRLQVHGAVANDDR